METTSMHKFSLAQDNVLVRPAELAFDSSGLWHPASKDSVRRGIVVLSAWDELQSGERILYPQDSGQPLRMNTNEYLLLDKEDILAKVEKS